MMSEFIWAFDCPWHGLEIGVHYFRAFQDEHKTLWKRFMLVDVEVTEGQVDAHLEQIRDAHGQLYGVGGML